MLHIRHRSEPLTSWSEHGWPALLDWGDLLEPPWLYWALNEIPPAAQHRDLDAVDDLLTEVALLLERIWRIWLEAPRTPDSGQFAPISAALWAEIQRGRGAEDLSHVTLHARLLRNATGPEQPGPRHPEAVPTYIPPEQRIRGGRLPVTTDVDIHDLTARPLHEQFLQLLATVLSNSGGGHVADHVTSGVPYGADPDRTGWAGIAPGELLGSIDDRGTYNDLILRPGPCVAATNQLARSIKPTWASFSEAAVGRALAQAWLIDSTIAVNRTQLRRLTTMTGPVLADHADEPLWRLPVSVFDPRQFHRPPAGRHPLPQRLRALPTDT